MPLFLAAQQKLIKHTVAAKESYSSIGRLYNINGRVLANFNRLDYDKGLSIGQVLNVPANAAAATVQPAAPKKEMLQSTIPAPVAAGKQGGEVKHIVGKKETLYAVSKKYNASIADIKKWNKLSGDGLAEGSEIIVGYGAEPVVEKQAVSVPQKTVPVVAKETAQKAAPEAKVAGKPTPPVPQKEMEKPASSAFNKTGAGVFKTGYADNGKEEKGTAGIFKSTSGWEDGKYYCLHNAATQGTIVKITNPANGKFVYAKVLDGIPDLKQNADLLVRISNAAADAIGAAADNFECTINY